jgi:DNA-directed RNA polymerase specialized sigma24 family protein
MLNGARRADREVLDLIVKLGCSHREAAATAVCTEGAMKVRYFTAHLRIEAVHQWLDTLPKGKARLLRLFIGLRLPLDEAARRVGTTAVAATQTLSEACVEMGALMFGRGRLMHPEVERRLCR